MKELFEQIKPHLIAIAILLAICMVYFLPQLKGEMINQDDITAGVGMTKETNDYYQKTGEVSLWTNAMFGGMPTYQISSPQRSNYVRRYVEPLMQLKISHPISWFFVAGLCFYILLIVVGLKQWTALLGALAFAFTTNQLLLYEAGHTSKFRALGYIPLVIAGVYLLLEKKKWIGGSVLFLLGLSLNISANHYQMTYYFAIAMIVFALVYISLAISKNEAVPVLKAFALMAVCSVLAIAPSASKIMTTYEYANETMRGSSQLKDETQSKKQEGVKKSGLEWDYAMLWSYAPRDFLSIFIPNAVGGSSAEPTSDNYEVAKLLGARGKKKVQAPMYWGGAESVAGPPYMGIIVFFFFVLGILNAKGNKFIISLLVGLTIVALISLGKYFSIFQHILFDHLPKYNNFRAHNSAIGVVAAMIPLIGFMGLNSFLNGDVDKKILKKNLITALSFTGGLVVLVGLFGSVFFDFEHMQDGRYLRMFNNDQNSFNRFLEDLLDDRSSMLRSSAFRSLIFMALAGGALMVYVQGKLKKPQLLMVLAALICIDQFSIDWKYVNHDDFQKKTIVKRTYTPRPVDQQILQAEPKGRGYYRVFDVSKGVNTFSSSFGSYFYNTVGGYSAVKLQRIQDVIDSVFSQGLNQEVMNMFNTKYIIFGEKQQVQLNEAALGNAWFVNSIRNVNSATEELQSLRSFKASQEAIVHGEWSDYLNGFKPLGIDSNGGNSSIELMEYSPNRMVYKANCSKEELAVFSEIWYGPNLGWQAYLNGDPVDHIRANYLMRGMRIPKGENEIVFEFNPKSYVTGEGIAKASSLLIILLLLGWVAMFLKPYFRK